MVQVVGLVDERLLTYYLAVVIDKDVTHNGVHPTFKIGIGLVFVFIIQGFKRGLLQQIIRFFPIGRQFLCKAKQFFLHSKQIFSKTVSVHTLLIFFMVNIRLGLVVASIRKFPNQEGWNTGSLGGEN